MLKGFLCTVAGYAVYESIPTQWGLRPCKLK
jgi:hypothetical protein